MKSNRMTRLESLQIRLLTIIDQWQNQGVLLRKLEGNFRLRRESYPEERTRGRKNEATRLTLCPVPTFVFHLHETLDSTFKISRSDLGNLARDELITEGIAGADSAFRAEIEINGQKVTLYYRLKHSSEDHNYVQDYYYPVMRLKGTSASCDINVETVDTDDLRCSSGELGIALEAWVLTEKGIAVLDNQRFCPRADHKEILTYLSKIDSAIQSAIQTNCNMGRNKVSELSQELENAGFVSRPDGERKGYKITDAGREFLGNPDKCKR